MDYLPSEPSPDTNISRAGKPNIREAQFGDGYSQRKTIGLNQAPIEFSLVYSTLNTAQKQVLETFILFHNSGEAFLWQMPDETTPRKWYLKDWNITYVAYGIFNVSLSLKEVFDI